MPEGLIAFASDEGRALFREALAEGTLEGFFSLAEQFHTQADPAFCALGSLVVVLNALGVDPGRLWKGPWRWYSEELLDCCAPLERVRARGLTLDEVACLARCNGSTVRVERATGDSSRLRADLREACSSPQEPIVVASYSRAALGQTGTGHYSPLGGYHSGRDLALVLDVARFKYPPHWVPLEGLHHAMRALDPETASPRGWMVFRRRASPAALLYCVSNSDGGEALLSALEAHIPETLRRSAPRSSREALQAFATALSELAPPLELRSAAAPEHSRAVEAVREALRSTEVWKTLGSDPATVMALTAPDDLWGALRPEVLAELLALLAAARALPAIADEIAQLQEQLAALKVIVRQNTP